MGFPVYDDNPMFSQENTEEKSLQEMIETYQKHFEQMLQQDNVEEELDPSDLEIFRSDQKVIIRKLQAQIMLKTDINLVDIDVHAVLKLTEALRNVLDCSGNTFELFGED